METILLTLHAQTSIHAGSGQNDSVIDLPIQREAHTSYPCIFGSSMKGALRAHAKNRANNTDDKKIHKLFGREGDTGQAGATLISDARILLLPVRTLTGQFKWVTCPAVLDRFKQDARRFGKNIDSDLTDVNLEPECVLTPTYNSDIPKKIYLEEYQFTESGEIDEKWVSLLSQFIKYENAESMLRNQLAILNNDDFAYLAKYTLPVNPHIAVDPDTKVTVGGALWYEETLPPDSILYVCVAVENERIKEQAESSSSLVNDFKTLFSQENPWLQIGGNETVGMGWCYVNFAEVSA